MKFQRVKGCFDILPEGEEAWKTSKIWRDVEKTIHDVCALFGFEEIRTPIFEYTEVFTRAIGDDTDVVSKEMYTFSDRKGRSLTLRPEITAATIRAWIENGLFQTRFRKLYYIGPCFRYDRSQKGRYRQFHQFGAEVFLPDDPYVDAEVIDFLITLYRTMGLKNTKLMINNLGSSRERDRYITDLKRYLTKHIDALSSDSKVRFEKNPLRILDSKEECDLQIVHGAPKLKSYLEDATLQQFEKFCSLLNSLNIEYHVDELLVRGLDYYQGMVFELVRSGDTSRQNSLGGGGRYNKLISAMGGPDEGGIGFAFGIERLIQSLTEEENVLIEITSPDVFLLPLSAAAKDNLFLLLSELRKKSVSAELYCKHLNRSEEHTSELQSQ